MPQEGLQAFISKVENRIEDIGAELELCRWDKYTGKQRVDENRIEARLSRILLNRSYYARIRRGRRNLHERATKRRLTILEKWFKKARVDSRPEVYKLRNKINDIIVGFKPSLSGKLVERTDIQEILRKDPNRERRKEAWLSNGPLAGRVEVQVRKLMEFRNSMASRLGYESYADLVLEEMGFKRVELLRLLNQVIDLSRDYYNSVLSEGARIVGVDRVEPWDVHYLIHMYSAPPPDEQFPRSLIVEKTYQLARSLGFTPERLPILVKEADIPFGGLCFGIKIPKDIRILTNPRDGLRHYTTMFHEFGHALHESHVKESFPSFKYGEASCFNEGMAQITGWFTYDSDWLEQNTSLSKEDISSFLDRWKRSSTVRYRTLIAGAVFEYLAYDDLSQDLNELWKKVHEKHLDAKWPYSNLWASDSFYTTHPIYLQNYIVADLIATQTHSYLKRIQGKLIGEPQTAKFLVEKYYAPGASVEWREKVKEATEEPLNARSLTQELGIKD